MEEIEAFYNLARGYCDYVGANKISRDSIPFLMERLMRLYISAQVLPELEMQEEEALTAVLHKDFEIRLDEQISSDYWEIYDPAFLDEPVCGNLADDLADIALDLQSGIETYDSGHREQAAFAWKFGLEHHWGKHVVDALRALHSIIRE